jgi:hypothetical protein
MNDVTNEEPVHGWLRLLRIVESWASFSLDHLFIPYHLSFTSCISFPSFKNWFPILSEAVATMATQKSSLETEKAASSNMDVDWVISYATGTGSKY